MIPARAVPSSSARRQTPRTGERGLPFEPEEQACARVSLSLGSTDSASATESRIRARDRGSTRARSPDAARSAMERANEEGPLAGGPGLLRTAVALVPAPAARREPQLAVPPGSLGQVDRLGSVLVRVCEHPPQLRRRHAPRRSVSTSRVTSATSHLSKVGRTRALSSGRRRLLSQGADRLLKRLVLHPVHCRDSSVLSHAALPAPSASRDNHHCFSWR